MKEIWLACYPPCVCVYACACVCMCALHVISLSFSQFYFISVVYIESTSSVFYLTHYQRIAAASVKLTGVPSGNSQASQGITSSGWEIRRWHYKWQKHCDWYYKWLKQIADDMRLKSIWRLLTTSTWFWRPLFATPFVWPTLRNTHTNRRTQ